MATVDARRTCFIMTQPLTRVAVTGSESTGKTTLARDLATHFGVQWVEEQSRLYAERITHPLDAADVGPIARAQIAAENAAVDSALRRGDRFLFLDTDLLSTVVYARHYYGSCPAWIEAEVRARRSELYLLAETDIPWTPDSVRDRPYARQQLHAEFRATLAEFGASVCPVRGLGDLRLQAAVSCVVGRFPG